MTQTLLRALLPLTFAGLLASCGGVVPVPQASGPALRALNEDICPSCGKASVSVQGVWVWPTGPALVLSTEATETEMTALQALSAEARTSGRFTHLTLWEQEVAGAQPLACFQPLKLSRPPEVPMPAVVAGRATNLWTGGHVAFSAPLAQHDLRSPEQGDALCAKQFGLAWRMLRSNDTVDALPLTGQPLDLWAFSAQP